MKPRGIKIKNQVLTEQPFAPGTAIFEDTVVLFEDTSALFGGQTSIISSVKAKIKTSTFKTRRRTRR